MAEAEVEKRGNKQLKRARSWYHFWDTNESPGEERQSQIIKDKMEAFKGRKGRQCPMDIIGEDYYNLPDLERRRVKEALDCLYSATPLDWRVSDSPQFSYKDDSSPYTLTLAMQFSGLQSDEKRTISLFDLFLHSGLLADAKRLNVVDLTQGEGTNKMAMSGRVILLKLHFCGWKQ